MCDTMIALGDSTLDGRVIFAKNSDRAPNERLLTERISASNTHREAK